jgi:hypothetical protein
MRFILIIISHIVAIVFLIWLGTSLNAKINQDYAGVITVFSLALAIYSTGVNILYQRCQRFHLFVNRIFLIFKRTHTFWQPHFHFEFDGSCDSSVIEDLWSHFSTGDYGKTVKKDQTLSTLRISIDNLFVMTLRIGDTSLDLEFDQKLLVPSHLYDIYRQRLSKLAEGARNTINPKTSKYSIIVSFGDGMRNPYYGFFVSRVPAKLLQNFQVTFRLGPHSDCRIEAGMDQVDIEGVSLTDTFDALNQVLSLKALPLGVPK